MGSVSSDKEGRPAGCCESLCPLMPQQEGYFLFGERTKGGGEAQNLTFTSPLSKAWAIFPRNSIFKISWGGQCRLQSLLRKGRKGVFLSDCCSGAGEIGGNLTRLLTRPGTCLCRDSV